MERLLALMLCVFTASTYCSQKSTESHDDQLLANFLHSGKEIFSRAKSTPYDKLEAELNTLFDTTTKTASPQLVVAMKENKQAFNKILVNLHTLIKNRTHITTNSR